MFPKAGRRRHRTRAGRPGSGKGVTLGRWQSRVREPAGALRRAAGRVPRRGDRHAGRGPGAGADHDRRQPGCQHAQRGRLRRALEELELMVSVDIYVNETTRHADVILPAPSSLCRSHYDLGALPARRPQRRQLLAAGRSSPTRGAARVADAAAPGGNRRRPGARRRRRRVRRLRGQQHGRARAQGARVADRRTRPPTRSWPRSSRGAGRSARST